MPIIFDLPINDYHAHSAISNSKLNDFISGGPEYFKQKYIDKTIVEEKTKALIMGQACEDYLFDLEGFDKKYVFRPEGIDLRTKDGKSWAASHVGYIILDSDARPMFEAIRKNIDRHPVASALLAAGTPQVTLRFNSTEFGVELQSRPDWVNFEGLKEDLVVNGEKIVAAGEKYETDLKTTLDFNDWYNRFEPSSPIVGRPIIKHGYHRQGAITRYLALQEPELGLLRQFRLVVEKQAPFRVGVVEMDDNYLEIGMMDVALALAELRKCYETNTWPLGPDGLIKLTPPQYLEASAARKWDANN